MSDLVIHAGGPGPDGSLLEVTPESAGWHHVGFEALALAPGQSAERDAGDREVCVVVIQGHCHVSSEHGHWRDIGERPDPFAGKPDAAYLPPGTHFTVEGAGQGAEIGL
ncbi:MAG: 5-deoxy-glucuronate isomerase, partial [Thermoleophilales bacterium]|nr:5-deoxy-glucuronate isomerase [Thermoleophilales bacterium]